MVLKMVNIVTVIFQFQEILLLGKMLSLSYFISHILSILMKPVESSMNSFSIMLGGGMRKNGIEVGNSLVLSSNSFTKVL